jgi:hypothetical protein
MTSTQYGHSMDVDASAILVTVPVSPSSTPTALPAPAVHISSIASAGHPEPAVPNAATAPLTSAVYIMCSHHDKMTWRIGGWLGGAIIYHPQRCATCNSCIAHVVEANHRNHLLLSTESVELALRTAWLCLLRDIERDALRGPRHAYEDLQERTGHLQEQVTALQASLEREKQQVACLTDELKKKQETHHAPPKFTTKLSSVSLVPTVLSSCAVVGTAMPTPLTASSSHATAGTLVPASFKMSQPMPSSLQVTINLTKEEDRNDVLDRRGVTPDYGMEFGSDEELLKREALELVHTLNSIPRGAKCQGKVRKLARNKI